MAALTAQHSSSLRHLINNRQKSIRNEHRKERTVHVLCALTPHTYSALLVFTACVKGWSIETRAHISHVYETSATRVGGIASRLHR